MSRLSCDQDSFRSGILLCLHGVSRDLELEIKLQEREVIARHIAYERKHGRPLPILSGKELGARRFGDDQGPLMDNGLQDR
jgi:hypothetical protein